MKPSHGKSAVIRHTEKNSPVAKNILYFSIANNGKIRYNR